MIASILLSFFLFQVPSVLGTPTPTPAVMSKISEMAKPTPIPMEEPLAVTRHSIRVGNSQLNYTVTTGFMPIKNRDGETEARMFFMAYTADKSPDVAKRPLMF